MKVKAGARFGLVTAAAVIAAFAVACAMEGMPTEPKLYGALLLVVIFGGFGALAAMEE